MGDIRKMIILALLAIGVIVVGISIVLIPTMLIFNKLEKKFNIDPIYLYPIVFGVVILELLMTLYIALLLI